MRVSPTTDLRTARESAETSAPTPEAPVSQPSVYRAAVQHLGGEHRHQHGVRIAHQADQRKEQKNGADRAKCAHVVPPFAHLLEHAGPVGAAIKRLDAHQQQGCDHGEVADAVDQETPALADRADHQAGDGRPDQPRTVGHRGIDRDGVTEVVAIVDHLDQEGLPPRHVERIDHPLQRGERDDFPQRDDMCQRERRQGERLDGAGGLRPHQQLAAIEALHPHARKRPQRKRNDLSREAYDAQQQRRMGQVIDQPGRRQPRHPGADHRDALTEEEELEVAVPQRSPGVRN